MWYAFTSFKLSELTKLIHLPFPLSVSPPAPVLPSEHPAIAPGNPPTAAQKQLSRPTDSTSSFTASVTPGHPPTSAQKQAADSMSSLATSGNTTTFASIIIVPHINLPHSSHNYHVR